MTDSPHDLGCNIHNRCGVRIGNTSTHGVCPVHSLPVYREPGGIDWFTDDAGARGLPQFAPLDLVGDLHDRRIRGQVHDRW